MSSKWCLCAIKWHVDLNFTEKSSSTRTLLLFPNVVSISLCLVLLPKVRVKVSILGLYKSGRSFLGSEPCVWQKYLWHPKHKYLVLLPHRSQVVYPEEFILITDIGILHCNALVAPAISEPFRVGGVDPVTFRDGLTLVMRAWADVDLKVLR